MSILLLENVNLTKEKYDFQLFINSRPVKHKIIICVT